MKFRPCGGDLFFFAVMVAKNYFSFIFRLEPEILINPTIKFNIFSASVVSHVVLVT